MSIDTAGGYLQCLAKCVLEQVLAPRPWFTTTKSSWVIACWSSRLTRSTILATSDSSIAAGGFDIAHWRNKSIIVAFENIPQRGGQEHRLIRSLMITPGKGEEVIVTDMYTQQEVLVERGR